jgi:membrane protein involved in colicin uptake
LLALHPLQETKERAKRKTEGPLSTKRFEALEHLLQQSEAYSTFLAEQLADIDEQAKERAAGAEQGAEGAEAPAEPEAPVVTKNGKRKRKGGAAEAVAEAKKPKSSKTPTEVGPACREGGALLCQVLARTHAAILHLVKHAIDQHAACHRHASSTLLRSHVFGSTSSLVKQPQALALILSDSDFCCVRPLLLRSWCLC